MESIGQQLQDAREAQGLTISQAAAATRIKFQHIESMERDDYSSIAAAAYARGFLKIYAEYLGLAPDALIREYNLHYAPAAQRGVLGDTDESRGSQAAARGRALSGDAGDGNALPRVVGVGIAVLVVVGLVLGISALLRGGGGEDDGPAPAGAIDEPLRIGDPPDPYLAMPNPDQPDP